MRTAPRCRRGGSTTRRWTLAIAVGEAGPEPEVVLEATWGWYWAADVSAEAGAGVHLAHPLGVKGFENRRVKNDDRDATLLADLLRMGSLPESWIAPRSLRELRELVRYRRKLSQLRTGLQGPGAFGAGQRRGGPVVDDIVGAGWGPVLGRDSPGGGL